jgi:hypothetical protein
MSLKCRSLIEIFLVVFFMCVCECVLKVLNEKSVLFIACFFYDLKVSRHHFFFFDKFLPYFDHVEQTYRGLFFSKFSNDIIIGYCFNVT